MRSTESHTARLAQAHAARVDRRATKLARRQQAAELAAFAPSAMRLELGTTPQRRNDHEVLDISMWQAKVV
ncbi:hypothetical protein [Nakamurella leprariae]|uniref:Uncharacterized protein n=1 Tax=Nakamurella leprariae TaxID=2803911 RepID=A0A938YDJ9_9ACTN|nr:hypothetical protein [Nakamurella leprariae]MBM9466462.1 hypothetical protein [Nakamurella leprariae]